MLRLMTGLAAALLLAGPIAAGELDNEFAGKKASASNAASAVPARSTTASEMDKESPEQAHRGWGGGWGHRGWGRHGGWGGWYGGYRWGGYRSWGYYGWGRPWYWGGPYLSVGIGYPYSYYPVNDPYIYSLYY
jgi:hypothetical protein